MLYASIERCPHPDGKIKSFDASAAKKVNGVLDVLTIEGSGFPAAILVHAGVAVVATNHFAALKARKLLKITWQPGKDSQLSSADLTQDFSQKVSQPGNLAVSRGNVSQALAEADQTLEATYQLPFLAHAPLETPNATAVVSNDKCELWCGIQSASKLQGELERRLGMSKENIIINPLLCGGSFGRRLEVGFGVEAALLARQVKKPLQLLWSREDDMQMGLYRTASMHKMQAAISQGKVTAFYENAAILSVASQQGMTKAFKNGVDTYYSDAGDFMYGIANLQFEQHIADQALPVSWWRGVAPTNYAFAYESWIDELAAATGEDPLAMRINLLERMKAEYIQKPFDQDYYQRVIAVLNKVASAAGWRKQADGRAQGIACYVFGKRTAVAHVVDVSLTPSGKVKVDKITTAVECGLAVNPDIVRAQFEGGALFALSTVFGQAVTIKDGAVLEQNFDSFPVMRMAQTPQFEVHILPSERPPQGVGEPCVMAIAPAVTNAIFALNGKRIRQLPVKAEDLQQS
jgi:isoquinoline 1-oxidoreductase beta subunit